MGVKRWFGLMLVLLALVCLVRCILGPRISDRVM